MNKLVNVNVAGLRFIHIYEEFLLFHFSSLHKIVGNFPQILNLNSFIAELLFHDATCFLIFGDQSQFGMYVTIMSISTPLVGRGGLSFGVLNKVRMIFIQITLTSIGILYVCRL